MLKNNREFSEHEKLIRDVEHYSSITVTQLNEQKESIQSRFKEVISQSNHSLNTLLFWSGTTAVLLLILMVTVTTVLSISTKKSFEQIIDRMKAQARKPTGSDSIESLPCADLR